MHGGCVCQAPQADSRVPATAGWDLSSCGSRVIGMYPFTLPSPSPFPFPPSTKLTSPLVASLHSEAFPASSFHFEKLKTYRKD